MPSELASTVRVVVPMDAVSRLRAVAALDEVREALALHRLAEVGSTEGSDVGTGYVLTGAIGVGLNRWTLRFIDFPIREVFELQAGESVESTEVDVAELDLERAQKIARTLGVSLTRVLSAAVCSGLAVITGRDVTVGPFEIAH
jgi:hypothetical protein